MNEVLSILLRIETPKYLCDMTDEKAAMRQDAPDTIMARAKSLSAMVA